MGTFGDYMDSNYMQVIDTFRTGDLIRNRYLPGNTYSIVSIDTRRFPNVEDPEVYFVAAPIIIDDQGELHRKLPVKVSSAGSHRVTREDLINDITTLAVEYENRVAAIRTMMKNLRS